MRMVQDGKFTLHGGGKPGFKKSMVAQKIMMVLKVKVTMLTCVGTFSIVVMGFA